MRTYATKYKLSPNNEVAETTMMMLVMVMMVMMTTMTTMNLMTRWTVTSCVGGSNDAVIAKLTSEFSSQTETGTH